MVSRGGSDETEGRLLSDSVCPSEEGFQVLEGSDGSETSLDGLLVTSELSPCEGALLSTDGPVCDDGLDVDCELAGVAAGEQEERKRTSTSKPDR